MTSYDTILNTAGSTGMVSGFYPPSGTLDITNTLEADNQVTIRAAGTVKNLFVRVISSGVIANTVTSRKNGANGNLTVTLTVGVTGTFEDTSHTDTVTAGDKIDTNMGSSDNFTLTLVSITYLASTDTVSFQVANGNSSTSATSQKFFQGLCGPLNINNATESSALNRQRIACTYKYLFLYIKSNSSTNTMTVKSRKNSAYGNLSISIGSSVTGILEDTTNSDTIAVGDDYCTEFNGTGMTSATHWTIIAVTQITTDGKFLMSCSDAAIREGTFASAITRYIPIMGRMIRRTTESDVQLKVRLSALKLKELVTKIVTNTINGTSTIRTRVGAANGAMSVSIASTTTGVFNDSTNSDTGLVSTSLINYQIVTGGSSGLLTVNYLGCYGDPVTSVLTNRTITEGAITASAATIVRKAIRPIANTVTVGSTTLIRKVTRPIANTVTVGTTTLLRKVIRPIAEPAKSVSDTITKIRYYFRTMTESSSITGTVARKVTRPISEPAKTITGTVARKVIRPIAEPAKSITGTLASKVVRAINDTAINVSGTVTKKAYKTITDPAKSITGTVALKVTRIISEPAKTISDTLTKSKTAIRSISEPAKSISQSLALKVIRPINEPSTSVSDSLVGHKVNYIEILEDAVSVTASLLRKVTRPITEPPKTISESLVRKVIHYISEPAKSISQTLALKIIRPINDPPKTVSDILARMKIANRSISQTVNVSDSVSVRTARMINEPAVNNVLDNITISRKRVHQITEPSISVSDSMNRRASFTRTISDTPVSVADILASSKVVFEEEHIFKLGRRIVPIVTNDLNFDLKIQGGKTI